ncbi:glycosyl transferase family 1 [Acuticoccus sp.]|uniref:glycosyl transferase family 1 n=1 Tax=Acuticoccus sp. TaxID=1904378 RepID=UPI003B52B2D5
MALLGFYRGASPPATVAGVRPIALDRTADAAFTQRAMAVASARASAGRLSRTLGPVDAIVARNLETMPLAQALKARDPSSPPLTYEVLDVHRLLLGRSGRARVLRTVEGRLAAAADLLLVSSPAFVEEYFDPTSAVRLPTLLVENKVLNAPEPLAAPRAAGPPWRIGVFGALRCARSLELLGTLASALDGRVEVVIRGRPSSAVFDDFEDTVARWPHATYHGPYANPDDLPAIYHDVHFVWAIDYFEAGGNSEWLLPNRLYEAGAYRAVPLARRGTQTARALEAWGFGMVFGDDLQEELVRTFSTLHEARYRAEGDRVATIPRTTFVATDADCRALVERLATAGGGQAMARAS